MLATAITKILLCAKFIAQLMYSPVFSTTLQGVVHYTTSTDILGAIVHYYPVYCPLYN